MIAIETINMMSNIGLNNLQLLILLYILKHDITAKIFVLKLRIKYVSDEMMELQFGEYIYIYIFIYIYMT